MLLFIILAYFFIDTLSVSYNTNGSVSPLLYNQGKSVYKTPNKNGNRAPQKIRQSLMTMHARKQKSNDI